MLTPTIAFLALGLAFCVSMAMLCKLSIDKRCLLERAEVAEKDLERERDCLKIAARSAQEQSVKLQEQMERYQAQNRNLSAAHEGIRNLNEEIATLKAAAEEQRKSFDRDQIELAECRSFLRSRQKMDTFQSTNVNDEEIKTLRMQRDNFRNRLDDLLRKQPARDKSGRFRKKA